MKKIILVLLVFNTYNICYSQKKGFSDEEKKIMMYEIKSSFNFEFIKDSFKKYKFYTKEIELNENDKFIKSDNNIKDLKKVTDSLESNSTLSFKKSKYGSSVILKSFYPISYGDNKRSIDISLEKYKLTSNNNEKILLQKGGGTNFYFKT